MVGVNVGWDYTYLYELVGECACLYVGRRSYNQGTDGRTNDGQTKDVMPVTCMDIEWLLYYLPKLHAFDYWKKAQTFVSKFNHSLI